MQSKASLRCLSLFCQCFHHSSLVCQCSSPECNKCSRVMITKVSVSVMWSSRSACDHRVQSVSVVFIKVSVSVLWSSSSVCQWCDHQVQCVSVVITKFSVSVLWSQSSMRQCSSREVNKNARAMITKFSVSVLWSSGSMCHCCEHQVQCVRVMIKVNISVLCSPS